MHPRFSKIISVNNWKKVPEKGDENDVSKLDKSNEVRELKKAPEKGDENTNVFTFATYPSITNWKKSPRKGTKTELFFAQMSPYVSREDPREGDETYLTW